MWITMLNITNYINDIKKKQNNTADLLQKETVQTERNTWQ